MILLEIIGLLFLLLFFTFPYWIEPENIVTEYNWLFNKEWITYKKQMKLDKKKHFIIEPLPPHKCSQKQPFMVTKQYGIICNFHCDGDCPYTDIERLKATLISKGVVIEWEVKN